MEKAFSCESHEMRTIRRFTFIEDVEDRTVNNVRNKKKRQNYLKYSVSGSE